MEREILYRGKRVDNGEWIYGGWAQRHNDNTEYIVTSTVGASCKSEINNIIATGFRVELDTIGQYTGLTDKNGKKIFKGDILDLSALMITDFGVVKYGEYKDSDMRDDIPCGHVGFYVDIEEQHYNYVRRDILFFVSRCKVVGNVYDNPELLEDMKDD